MLLIIAAVPLETDLLRQQLVNAQSVPFHGYQIFSGRLAELPILIAHTGVGQIAMAMQLTRLLTEVQPTTVFLLGCGGSYPASGLKNGDLVLASEEICGDFGVACEAGFTPLDQLEIRQQPELAPRIQQRFSLQSKWTEQVLRLLPEATSGPFVTVNCCSGTPQLSAELQRRTNGICENMEGAAAAQVCAEFKLPLLELRGISNPTGTRDAKQWDIRRAADAAQRGLLSLLPKWPQIEE